MATLQSAQRRFFFPVLAVLGVLLVSRLAAAPGVEDPGSGAPRASDAAAAAKDGTKGKFDAARQNCISAACHSKMNRKKNVHGPSAREACRICHAPEGTVLSPENAPRGECVATWKLLKSTKELCQSCHKLNLKNVVHEPVAKGKCDSCHDPHESDLPHLLKKDLARELCLDCHGKDEEFLSKKHVHGPVESGACVLCHESHSSWNAKLVRKASPALCLDCHEEIGRNLSSARHTHSPVQEDCGNCHDPHASDIPYQLKEPVATLCLGCHPKVQALLDSSQYVHGAIQEERSCLACHLGHASNFARLLAEPPMDSCLRCHDEPVQATDGSELTDMAKLLQDNPEHHGPIRRADCSGCHNPHASATFRLLKKPYPSDFYLPKFDVKSYGLCFSCHFKEMVLVEKGPGVTRFQKGDLNLHYLHVNREKSRTCRACHAVHASKNPLHIRDTFVFGVWKEAPVKFKPLPGGGSCAPACHKTVRYERGSDVPLPPVKTHETTE